MRVSITVSVQGTDTQTERVVVYGTHFDTLTVTFWVTFSQTTRVRQTGTWQVTVSHTIFVVVQGTWHVTGSHTILVQVTGTHTVLVTHW